MTTSVILLSVIAVLQDGAVDAKQFHRLISAIQADYKDVCFAYEGTMDYVGSNPPRNTPREHMNLDYTGTYALRDDGATFLEEYTRWGSHPERFHHNIYSALNGNLGTIANRSDAKDVGTIRHSAWTPGALNRPGSPERIVALWFFKTRGGSDDALYRFRGWKNIDGRRCLCAEFAELPGVPWDQQFYTTYWLDLDRGGHALQIEYYAKQQLVMRTRDIRLATISSVDGKQLWFPVSGVTDSFRGLPNEILGEPTFRETMFIANSSVRINQGLTDKTLAPAPRVLTTETAKLAKLRTDFDAIPVLPERTDAAGVEERLNTRLEQAESQGKMLEASSAARSPWTIEFFLQIILMTVGAGILGSLAWYRWKTS